MKHIDRIVKRLGISLLSAIAGVSVAGCGGGGTSIQDRMGSMYGPAPAYGAPKVTISGKVAQSNGAPVENILIVEFGQSKATVVHTAADGTYIVGGCTPGSSIKILVRDVDGPDHGGEFDEQTIDLGIVNTLEKQLDIVLQPKSHSPQ